MKTKLVSILVLASFVLGACGTSATPKQTLSTPVPGIQEATPTTAVQSTVVEITILDFKFDPATVTVPVGTTVTWKNKDSANHTVVADDGSWTSESLATDATFSFTFDKAGTYTYICSIHPSMKGTVIVQ